MATQFQSFAVTSFIYHLQTYKATSFGIKT